MSASRAAAVALIARCIVVRATPRRERQPAHTCDEGASVAGVNE